MICTLVRHTRVVGNEFLLAFAAIVLAAANLMGQDLSFPSPDAPPPARAAATAEPPLVADRERPSPEAEKIARAHRTVESTRKLVADLATQLDDPEGEFQKYKESFVAVDEEYQQKRSELDAVKRDGNSEAVAALAAEFPRVERKWRLIKERFELKIEERKQLVEQMESLKQKLAKDEEALARLVGTPKPDDEAESPSPPVVAGASNEASKGSEKASSKGDAPLAPADPEPALATPPAAPAKTANASAAGVDTVSAEDEESSKEVQAAAELATQKQAAAKTAEDAARSIGERIALLQESVQAARSLRETMRKQVDNADASVHALEAAVQRRMFEEATPEQLQSTQQKLAEARGRLASLRAQSRERTNELDELQMQLTELQSEQINAMREAEQRRAEAAAAQKQLDHLQNPFSLHNLLRWGLEHGPPLFAILMAMASLVWLARVMEHRLVDLIAHRGGRGGVEERENQAKTLVGVFRNAVTMVIIAGGILMLLDEVNIPIAPLMGGAAVFGLAVAFGAQSLIKDFFSGFMILLEQQYMVNDVVKIGDISGQVERITLRTTVLRDMEGRVHFVPHGQITATTNMTHGWSRAVFDIPVSYREDVDHLIEVLVALGRQLRRDPQFGPLILEDPVMLGIDSFSDTAIIVKFYLKTRPLRQWPVKRELLRRIKVAFDEMGIEIPNRGVPAPAASPRNTALQSRDAA